MGRNSQNPGQARVSGGQQQGLSSACSTVRGAAHFSAKDTLKTRHFGGRQSHLRPLQPSPPHNSFDTYLETIHDPYSTIICNGIGQGFLAHRHTWSKRRQRKVFKHCLPKQTQIPSAPYFSLVVTAPAVTPAHVLLRVAVAREGGQSGWHGRGGVGAQPLLALQPRRDAGCHRRPRLGGGGWYRI